MYNKYNKYNETKTKTSGIGFLPLLALVFITLKLCNVISWSWFWVLSPLLFPFALVLGIVAFLLICKLIIYVFCK